MDGRQLFCFIVNRSSRLSMDAVKQAYGNVLVACDGVGDSE